jgi:signal peptidase
MMTRQADSREQGVSRLLNKNKTKKTFRAPVRQLLLVLLAVVLGLKLYSWNAGSLAGNRMPMPFGCGASIVLSGSMEPALSVNDLVFIRQTQDIEPGDIIVYQSGGELVIHRVISRSGNQVITRGDANNVADDPVDVVSVKGKMIGRIPALGGLVRLIKTPAGTVTLLAAAILLMELSYRREREQHDDELEAIREEIRRLKKEGE